MLIRTASRNSVRTIGHADSDAQVDKSPTYQRNWDSLRLVDRCHVALARRADQRFRQFIMQNYV